MVLGAVVFEVSGVAGKFGTLRVVLGGAVGPTTATTTSGVSGVTPVVWFGVLA
ncbi:hypothetical protein [Saccharothrix hoggarensis]|uniref:Uncharacterized protein n=1 Tax=Saccharothrix hoggarensis TaxID=913853 RepID=A0ABW3R345_9PSEU